MVTSSHNDVPLKKTKTKQLHGIILSPKTHALFILKCVLANICENMCSSS